MSDVYVHRRQRYMEAIGPESVALVRSPPEVLRNGDALFPFRQSSDLHYLTGFVEPETTLVLRPGASDHRVVMFVRPKDREREIWDGRRAGVEGAVADFGAEVAYPSDELATRLPALIGDCADLYYSLGLDPSLDTLLARTIAELRSRERRGRRAPKRVVDPREVLHEMRLIKGAAEAGILRRAAAITAEAHRAAMAMAAPGGFEYELEALVDFTFRRRGGMGPGYSSIVGSGDNATVLHYHENDRAMEAGDLVLIDAGCEFDFYTADVTRTFPANGRFGEAQRACYEVVLDAQVQGIAMTRPGVTIDEIHERTVEILTEGMVTLGLLEGPAADRIADESYKKFYMHRTSHWLGMDVHDVGRYNTNDGDGDRARPLEPGMVITIEPGLYIARDAEGVPDAFRGIGIRIEDDILVTDDGNENLTSATPKTVAEVEAACKNG
jgi:Xaa-Pro aminopeptidase